MKGVPMSCGTKFFILTESILYIIFLTLDLTGVSGSAWLKYAGILLCVCFGFAGADSREDRLIALALFFTAAADFFLLVLNRHYEAGVFIFCLVQLLYCVRLTFPEKKCPPGEIALRIGIPAALIPLLALLHRQSLLNILVSIYFTNLVINALKSLRRPELSPMPAGFFLFIGCDICVGLFNLNLQIPWLYTFAAYAMWAFYLPSQVLITLSVLIEHERS